MRKLPKILEFEWDKGNFDKSYEKHGITQREAEEIFISEELFVKEDVKHSQKEERFIAFGRSQSEIFVLAVFTMRKNRIRIISARKMHRKEIEKYEKAKKDSAL